MRSRFPLRHSLVGALAAIIALPLAATAAPRSLHPDITLERVLGVGVDPVQLLIVRGCAAGEWMNPALKREARIPGVGIDGETHHNASCTPYPYGK